MSTNRPDFLRRWLPDWLQVSAQTHNDLLEQQLTRIGVTMAAYGIFKGLSETMFVGLCIFAVAEGAPPGLAVIAAGAVVLGWEGAEKLLLLNTVDADVLEQLQDQPDEED